MMTLSEASPFVTTDHLKFSGQRSMSPKKEVQKTPMLMEEPQLAESSEGSQVYHGEQFDSEEDRL